MKTDELFRWQIERECVWEILICGKFIWEKITSRHFSIWNINRMNNFFYSRDDEMDRANGSSIIIIIGCTNACMTYRHHYQLMLTLLILIPQSNQISIYIYLSMYIWVYCGDTACCACVSHFINDESSPSVPCVILVRACVLSFMYDCLWITPLMTHLIESFSARSTHTRAPENKIGKTSTQSGLIFCLLILIREVLVVLLLSQSIINKRNQSNRLVPI